MSDEDFYSHRSSLSTFRSNRRGFTLVEALIAVVILAVATVGIASLLGAASQQTAAMQDTSVCQELARQLMEEIASKPVNDTGGNFSTGPSAGETSRALFNQIGDYNGYSDTTDSITLLNGTTVDLGDGQTYTRSVSVEYRLTPSGVATLSAAAPFCVVAVTVSSSTSPGFTLTRLFSRTTGGS